jgi:hypothetical protein
MIKALLNFCFVFFENNPDFNFGNSGNLVRILEKFYLEPFYENKLYKSVERKPTEYNLWMLNRLLNTLDEEKKKTGICLLKNGIENHNLSESLRFITNEFFEE